MKKNGIVVLLVLETEAKGTWHACPRPSQKQEEPNALYRRLYCFCFCLLNAYAC
jgi:hypothetical protein